MEYLTLLSYLDPASGSLTFQILIGGLVAALAVLRRYWSRIAFWKRSGK